jgi:hypothetical protein
MKWPRTSSAEFNIVQLRAVRIQNFTVVKRTGKARGDPEHKPNPVSVRSTRRHYAVKILPRDFSTWRACAPMDALACSTTRDNRLQVSMPCRQRPFTMAAFSRGRIHNWRCGYLRLYRRTAPGR